MKTTLGKLHLSAQSLSRLAQQPLPGKVAYWIGRLISAAQSELKALEETRVKLVKQHGEQPDPEKEEWRVKPELLMAFSADLEELLQQEIELPGRVFSVEELGEKIELAPLDFLNLDWLIRE